MENKNVYKTAKSRKIIYVLLAAAVCMAVAAYGAYQLLLPQRTTIYLFNGDCSAGTQITRGMVKEVEVDSKIYLEGLRASTGDYLIASQQFDDVLRSAGQLRYNVNSGLPLTTSMLTTTGDNTIEMLMKQNAIAVTVGVNNIFGVTTDLAHGSRVNVYASYNAQTILLLQNVRVITASHNASGLSSVTLELDHEQSMEVIHAQTYGSIHLGLVDSNGYQYTRQDKPTYTLAGYTVTADTGSSTGETFIPGIPEVNDDGENAGIEP